jgi:hypothetical protein
MALGSARRRVCLRPLKPHTGARPRTAIIVRGHSAGWLTLLAAQASSQNAPYCGASERMLFMARADCCGALRPAG